MKRSQARTDQGKEEGARAKALGWEQGSHLHGQTESAAPGGEWGAGGEGGRWTRQIVQACYAILWSCWDISKMYFKVNRRWLEGFFPELSFILFSEYILLIMLLVVPIFPPLPSLYPHPSSTLLPSSSPPLSSCPWVMPISSLASPFSILRFLNIIDFILCAMGLSLALYDYIY